MFVDDDSCCDRRRDWMNVEHEEKMEPTLTTNEHFILSHLNPNYYIAKDAYEGFKNIRVFSNKPKIKWDGCWIKSSGTVYNLSSLLRTDANACIKLDFIKLDDEEPWKI